jgi:hypothetical protein
MKKFFIFLLFFLISCQPVEIIEPIVFDNTQLKSFTISAENIEINQIYQSNFVEPYIDHSLKITPNMRLNNWIVDNIKTSGSENFLEINILDASIKKHESINSDAKKFEEKNIYIYELFFLVEYNLYTNLDYLIASTVVEANRTTTSGQFISLSEKDRIIDELILDSLIDLSNESNELLNIYFSDYIL